MEKALVCCCMEKSYRGNQIRVFKGFAQRKKKPERKYKLQSISCKSFLRLLTLYINLSRLDSHIM